MSTRVCKKAKEGKGCGKELPIEKFDKYGEKYFLQCRDCRGEKKCKNDVKTKVNDLGEGIEGLNSKIDENHEELGEAIHELKEELEKNTKLILGLTARFEKVLKNRESKNHITVPIQADLKMEPQKQPEVIKVTSPKILPIQPRKVNK